MTPDLDARIKGVGSKVTAELLEWGRERRTGRIEIVVTDGAPVHIHRHDTTRLPKTPVFKDDRSPCCSAALVNRRDFGHRAECVACGRTCLSTDEVRT